MRDMGDFLTAPAPDWASMTGLEQAEHLKMALSESLRAIDSGSDEHAVERAFWKHVPPERRVRADVTGSPPV